MTLEALRLATARKVARKVGVNHWALLAVCRQQATLEGTTWGKVMLAIWRKFKW